MKKENLLEVSIDASYIGWENSIISHKGRSEEIKYPVVANLPQGRKSNDFVLAERQFEIYKTIETEEAIARIEALLESEKKEQQNKLNLLEQKIASIETTKSSKLQQKHRFVAKFGITMMGTSTLFAFIISLINFKHFFGQSLVDMTNEGITWFLLTILSLVFALSTPLFALMKDKQMVKKTVALLPIDFGIAMVYTRGVVSPSWGPIFDGLVIMFYIISLGLIMYSLTTLLMGVPTKDKENYNESLMGSLLE